MMYRTRTTGGFTLIEMIVSLTLFSAVITIAVGAFLVLLAANKQLQEEQAVLTNLSFALDSMTREIRTGSGYVVTSWSSQTSGGSSNPFDAGNDLDDVFPAAAVNSDFDGRARTAEGEPASTARVHGIAFVEGGDSVTGSSNQRIVYFHDAESQALYRRVGTGAAEQITSNGIAIVDADFFVSGAEPLFAGNETQPAVTVYIEAQVADAVNPKTYPIQTTVVQRILDL